MTYIHRTPPSGRLDRCNHPCKSPGPPFPFTDEGRQAAVGNHRAQHAWHRELARNPGSRASGLSLHSARRGGISEVPQVPIFSTVRSSEGQMSYCGQKQGFPGLRVCSTLVFFTPSVEFLTFPDSSVTDSQAPLRSRYIFHFKTQLQSGFETTS